MPPNADFKVDVRTRSRGRRPGHKVPCDACIARASELSSDVSTIDLCNECTAFTHQNRNRYSRNTRKPQERNEIRASPLMAMLKTSTSGISNIPWSNNPREHQAIQSFIDHTVPQLATDPRSQFWGSFILDAGRKELAVKHAMAAVGALHRGLLAKQSGDVYLQDTGMQFALQQCNKSIEHLKSEAGAVQNLELLLTTCVLFGYFAALQGRCEEAFLHATQGSGILQQFAADPKKPRQLIESFSLELAHLRCSMRRLQIDWQRHSDEAARLESPDTVAEQDFSNQWSTLEEGQESLRPIIHRLALLYLDLTHEESTQRAVTLLARFRTEIDPSLERWATCLSQYSSEHEPSFDTAQYQHLKMLEAHYLLARLLTKVDFNSGERAWEPFHQDFATIVDITEMLMSEKRGSLPAGCGHLQVSVSSTDDNNPTDIFNVGTLLYEVLARCQDQAIRRRALIQLSRMTRPEHIWQRVYSWRAIEFCKHYQVDASTTPLTESADLSLKRRTSHVAGESARRLPQPLRRRSSGHIWSASQISFRQIVCPGFYGRPSSSIDQMQHNVDSLPQVNQIVRDAAASPSEPYTIV